MQKFFYLAGLCLALLGTARLEAQSHLGVNARDIVSITFDMNLNTHQYLILHCQNGVQIIDSTDANGVWNVPAGKTLVLLSMQVHGNCTQAYSSPSGFSITTLRRDRSGSQVGFPYITNLPQREYQQGELFTASDSWPSGLVIPSGHGLEAGVFNPTNPPPAEAFEVTYYGYYTAR